jgi:hypothetical protein
MVFEPDEEPKTSQIWLAQRAQCRRKNCEESIAVYIHPAAEIYKLNVCHICTAREWAALSIQRGYH